MAQVAVTIGGRTYRLACNEGEEAHLEGLALSLDAKFEAMHKSFGEIGDQRLIVMAALTIADELAEARDRIAALEADANKISDRERSGKRDADLQAIAVAQAFGDLSQRIEKLAAALSGGGAA
jgi:cell division protein ZapA